MSLFLCFSNTVVYCNKQKSHFWELYKDIETQNKWEIHPLQIHQKLLTTSFHPTLSLGRFLSSSKLTGPLDQLGWASEAKTITKLFRPPSQPQQQPLLMGNAWAFCLKRWYMKIRKTWLHQCLMKLKSPWLKYCMKRKLLLLTVVMGTETRPPLRSLTLPMLPIMGRFMRLTSRKKEGTIVHIYGPWLLLRHLRVNEQTSRLYSSVLSEFLLLRVFCGLRSFRKPSWIFCFILSFDEWK